MPNQHASLKARQEATLLVGGAVQRLAALTFLALGLQHHRRFAGIASYYLDRA